MEERFGLGRPGAALLVREEGLQASFEAGMPDDKQGLYKVYITGRGGSMLLGTLMPEGGRLFLRRGFPIAELTRKGVWPVTAGEVKLSFPFGAPRQQSNLHSPVPGWVREENPARLMGDRVLARSAGELRGALFRRGEDGFSLAAPLEKERAFPLTPLFCFAHLEKLSEKNYIIFHFNSKGCPVFENKKKKTGDTDGANQKKE